MTAPTPVPPCATSVSLPASLPLPRVFQSAAWLVSPERLIAFCRRHLGDPFTVRLPGVPPIVVLGDPEAVREVITGDPEVFHVGEANAELKPAMWLRSFGRHSLFLLDEGSHRAERRWMMKAFTPRILQAHETAIADCTRRAVRSWPVGVGFDLHDGMRELTLHVLLRTLFGAAGDDETFRRVVRRMLALGDHSGLLVFGGRETERRARRWSDLARPLSPWAALEDSIRDVDARVRDEIAARSRGAGSGDDLLSVLLRARDPGGEPIDEASLLDEVRTLLIAGKETTARALTFALLELLQNQEALARFHEELPRGREYTDAVVRETLRLHPIVPLLARRLMAPTRVGGRDYPAGTVLAASVQLVHHDERRWPDPERFLPERFLGTEIAPFEFLPFGRGLRRCLGRELALLELRTIVRLVLTEARLALAGPRGGRSRRRSAFAAPDGILVRRVPGPG